MTTSYFISLGMQAAPIGALSWAFGNSDIFKQFVAIKSVQELAKAVTMTTDRLFPQISSKWKVGAGYAISITAVWFGTKKAGYPIEKLFLNFVKNTVFLTSAALTSQAIGSILHRTLPKLSQGWHTGIKLTGGHFTVWLAAQKIGYPVDKAFFIIPPLFHLSLHFFSEMIAQSN